MAALETADRQDGELASAKSVRLNDKIAALKAQMQAFKAMEVEVHALPADQEPTCSPAPVDEHGKFHSRTIGGGIVTQALPQTPSRHIHASSNG